MKIFIHLLNIYKAINYNIFRLLSIDKNKVFLLFYYVKTSIIKHG